MDREVVLLELDGWISIDSTVYGPVCSALEGEMDMMTGRLVLLDGRISQADCQ